MKSYFRNFLKDYGIPEVHIAIFDFDGTIVDSREAMKQIMHTISDEYGLQRVTDEELLELRKLPIVQRLKRLGISRFKLPRIARRSLTLLAELIEHVGIYDGMKQTLEELRHRGVHTMILSSNRRHTIQRCLERNGISAGFNHIYCTRGLFSKDKYLKRILREHAVSPDTVVYVGDELRDIEASRRAGVWAIAVTWGYDSADLLISAKPDFLAQQPCDIVQFIAS